ncbi:MAG: DUF2059 domain-containing protein [Pseudomonadota bacterium]
MRFITIVAAGFFATSAVAQSQELIDAATEYANSPVQQDLLDSMLSPEGVMAQMGLVAGQLPPDQVEILARIVSEELATIRPAMEAAMINGMANSFTLEEITALNDFYSSPVGASAMSKMNPFMQDTMAALAPEFQKMQVNLARRVQEEMSQ